MMLIVIFMNIKLSIMKMYIFVKLSLRKLANSDYSKYIILILWNKYFIQEASMLIAYRQVHKSKLISKLCAL